MSETNIPEAAIEAADIEFERNGATIRTVLEAAAPYIAAEAWDEGKQAIVNFKLAWDTERLVAKNDGRQPNFPDYPTNPYRADQIGASS